MATLDDGSRWLVAMVVVVWPGTVNTGTPRQRRAMANNASHVSLLFRLVSTPSHMVYMKFSTGSKATMRL